MMASSRTSLKPIDGGNIRTVDAALYLVDEVVSNLSSGNLQNGVVAINLMSLANYLKNHGAAVEAVCRDQLDRAFVRFRKSSLDGKTDSYSRRLMLYLIEMRANNWVSTESINRYYKTEEHFPMGNMPDNVCNNAGAVPALTSPTLPILAPGETIKSSGKYLAPTKIPGKNYFKDEVVIRNSDSGKVNPGAKERLVQVTGPDEAHINYAQQLMGDTIRRNASPVPFRSDQADIERVGGSSSSVNSSASDESTRIQGYPRARLHHSLSSNDATLDAYKYTVKPELSHVERPVSAFAAFREVVLPVDAEPAGRKYSRFALWMIAGAEICKEPPADWENVCPAALRKPATGIAREFFTSPKELEPKMVRPKSEPKSDKSILRATDVTKRSVGTTKILELPNMTAADNDSISVPSLLSLAADQTFSRVISPFTMTTSIPTAMPASSFITETLPLSPESILPPMNQESGEVVIRTTIPFRPKLTNPKLNYGRNNL